MKNIATSAVLIAALLLPACGEESPTEPASPEDFTLAAASAIHGLHTGDFQPAPGFLSESTQTTITPLTSEIKRTDLLNDARALAGHFKFYWTQILAALERRLIDGLPTADQQSLPEGVAAQGYFTAAGGVEVTVTVYSTIDFSETWAIAIRDEREGAEVSLDIRFELDSGPTVSVLGGLRAQVNLNARPVQVWLNGSISDGITTLTFPEASDPAVYLPAGFAVRVDSNDLLQYDYFVKNGFDVQIPFTVKHQDGLAFTGALRGKADSAQFNMPGLAEAEGFDILPPPDQLYLRVDELNGFHAGYDGKYTYAGNSANASAKLTLDPQPAPFTLDFLNAGGTVIRDESPNALVAMSTKTLFHAPDALRIDGRYSRNSDASAAIDSLELAGDLGTLTVTGLINTEAGLDRRRMHTLEVQDIAGNTLIYQADNTGMVFTPDGTQVGEIKAGKITINGKLIATLPLL